MPAEILPPAGLGIRPAESRLRSFRRLPDLLRERPLHTPCPMDAPVRHPRVRQVSSWRGSWSRTRTVTAGHAILHPLLTRNLYHSSPRSKDSCGGIHRDRFPSTLLLIPDGFLAFTSVPRDENSRRRAVGLSRGRDCRVAAKFPDVTAWHYH